MPVKPPAPRHTSEDLGNKLIISIPSLKTWFLTIYLGFCIIIWAIFELLIPGAFLFNRNSVDTPPVLFLVFSFILLTVFGLFLIYNFAWQVTGKELIEVTTEFIIIRRVNLGLSSPKEYSSNFIKELRVSSSNMNLNHPMLIWSYSYYYPWHPHNMGSLAFDYGARTFRFGGGVDEAEAKQILAEIQQKYPQYKN